MATSRAPNTPLSAQSDPKLDDEEKEILTAYEDGKTTRVADTVNLLARHRECAQATFRKDVL